MIYGSYFSLDIRNLPKNFSAADIWWLFHLPNFQLWKELIVCNFVQSPISLSNSKCIIFCWWNLNENVSSYSTLLLPMMQYLSHKENLWRTNVTLFVRLWKRLKKLMIFRKGGKRTGGEFGLYENIVVGVAFQGKGTFDCSFTSKKW